MTRISGFSLLQLVGLQVQKFEAVSFVAWTQACLTILSSDRLIDLHVD